MLADYYINTAKYANNCENKSRPKMHCQGKCQMMKKLIDAEENEKKEADKVRLSNSYIAFFQKSDVIVFLPLINDHPFSMSFPDYVCNYSSRYIDTIFIPPKESA
ncbi:hypothetical protein N180_01060 [Pedobacter antarcticus 4BY]|uniref:Uncharacterized protein n=1 Tax=Pedobacter antarcticus 4BY TaxID=1358423 RepID=A0A081PC30_9SPHI|nr:hypothetical protein N180_01060 [Pedobacter antarcticus 4BY]